MRKIIALLLVLSMAFVLCGCESVQGQPSMTPSNTGSFSPSPSTDDADYTNCVSVNALDIGWNEHYANADYYHYDFAVTNKSADCALSVTLSATFYDSKGNVVGTDRETVHALGKGETQYCELKTDVVFSRAEYTIEQAKKSIWDSGISELSFKVTTPNNKIIVEVKNEGTDSVEYGKAYCVFYNGNRIVDVDIGLFATPDDLINKGETQYAECSTKKSYTSYELYYFANKLK